MSDLKIPGLHSLSVDEQTGEILLDIDDDKMEEFYSFFNLEVGDTEGIRNVIVAALQKHMEEKENDS